MNENNTVETENTHINDTRETENNEVLQNTAAVNNKKSPKMMLRSFFNDLADIFENVMLLLLTFLLIRAYIFDKAVVDGTSMVPTLEPEQKLVYCKIYTPHNEDIIIAMNEKHGPIVKRVIATEGQEIDIKDGFVYVDGQKLNEQIYVEGAELRGDYFVNSVTTINGNAFIPAEDYPVTVPHGHVFIMGDNRVVSDDSRSANVGFVRVEDIIGKVVFRYFPWEERTFFID